MKKQNTMFLGGQTHIRQGFPNSSSIKSIEYDKVMQVLVVEFRKPSHAYVYYAVPEEVVSNLVVAASAGKFLSENIKKAGYKYTLKGPMNT